MSVKRIRGPLETQVHIMLKRIRKELEARRISMNRWSIAAGMDRNYVRRIFAEKRPMLIDTVDRLLDAAWMITGHDVGARIVLNIREHRIDLEDEHG
jgi:hypothetical protein